jgi:dephospho-CoA kinase
MLRIGLTGGIGAGKSTVSLRLVQLGATLVDADQIAREVVAPGSPGLLRVVDEFGSRILDSGGALDRPALAQVVFSDPEARTRLNRIVHPLVGARTQELIEAAPPDAVVVQDIPLLVESGMAPSFLLVVVVHAAPEERVRRLVAGRGMPEQDAMARIAAQADEPLDARSRTCGSTTLMIRSGCSMRWTGCGGTAWSRSSPRCADAECRSRLRRWSIRIRAGLSSSSDCPGG